MGNLDEQQPQRSSGVDGDVDDAVLDGELADAVLDGDMDNTVVWMVTT